MTLTSSTQCLLLVGPQRSKVTATTFSELKATIRNTPGLTFLADVIVELESIWPEIVTACPELERVQGKEILQSLREFFEQDDLPAFEEEPAKRSNILFDVMTVLSQAVDFWNLAKTQVRSFYPSTSSTNAFQLRDIQGFCIGFLTAAAISSSKNAVDFQKNITVALRLAVCAGALVELDSLRFSMSQDRAVSLSVGWNSDSEYVIFKELLKSHPSAYVSCVTDKTRVTVTMLARQATTFEQLLSKTGLSFQYIGLQGRYHCLAAHKDGLQSLKALLGNDERFQLPSAADLKLPLRSNVDGGLVSTGLLHEVALEIILLKQCNWYQTVQSATASTGIELNHILAVGSEATVPRSLTEAASPSSKQNNISNGFHHEATNGFENSTAVNSDGSPVVRDGSPIAIIGMSCRYPDADTLEDFWELISAGKSAVSKIPEDRFSESEITRMPKGPFWGNFLRHPDEFDHRLFGISGREAKYMDPQQRLVLQVAYETLESAGYFGINSSPDHFPSDIGCYLGVGSVDYADNIACHDASAFSALGTLRAFISGRISHQFGWSGPSITYDTACSSGAVAIHAAVNAIKANECSMALAGGVNVITSPALFQNLAAASFLNPTGASRAFDASANGYCRGEGAGLVLLKPLARALADGDSVLAVITGSAVNQGSNCTPITVPVSNSQSALYRKALSLSGTDPKEVTYVEAHGTGTPVGDPIECESIRQTFGGPHRQNELFLGSVKDNIGHAEAASGTAALIKTVLMMQKRVIPKQANFTRLNPKIAPLEPDHMAIPQHTQQWNASKRIAVVNNYGAAGSNAAIVVQDINLGKNETPVENGSSSSITDVEFPFFISAKTSESLQEYAIALKKSLSKIEQSHGVMAIVNLAYNLSVKQNREFEYNYTFMASTLGEVTSKLEQVARTNLQKRSIVQRPVVLCIGGQNGRTIHLDENLFRKSSILQRHLNDCEEACRTLSLPSIFPTIFKEDPVEDLVNLHCMLFSLQYASAKSWLDSGIQVDTIVGHSFGQLTALVVANALSLSDGLRIISARARLIQESWGNETGAMLSVQGDRSHVVKLLDVALSQATDFSVDIACYNGPDSVVLAGDKTSIDAVEKVAESEEFSTSLKMIRLKNTHAFHSRLTDPILPGLAEVAQTLRFKKPTIRIEACSRDQDWNKSLTAEMIVQHSRDPVYFDVAIQRIAQRLDSCVFIEAGSASPIVPMARKALINTNSDNLYMPIDIGRPKALSKLAAATCSLWEAGIKVQYWPFHHSQSNSFTWINLPPYQFHKSTHWMPYVAQIAEAPKEAVPIEKNETLQLLDFLERTSQGNTFRVNCTHEIFKLCTNGHAVLGQSLCPASMYVEIAVRAASSLAVGKYSPMAPYVKELSISAPLSINAGQTVLLQLEPISSEQDTWKFSIVSSGQLKSSTSIEHATGIVSLVMSEKYFQASRIEFLERLVGQDRRESLLSAPGSNILNGNIVYQVFGQVVDYAAYYRGIGEIVSKNNQAMGVVNLPKVQFPIMNEANCDPITLDNFLQVAGVHVNCLSEKNEDEVFICTKLGELFLSGKFIEKRREMLSWNVYSSFKKSSDKTLVNDIFVFDPQTGDLLIVFLGAIFQSVSLKSLARTLSKLNGTFSPNSSQSSGKVVIEQSLKAKPEYEAAMTKVTSNVQDTVHVNGTSYSSPSETLQKLRQLLSKVIEIPIEDVQPTATLAEVGIDSLMSTDVLNEIKAQFNVEISASDFLELTSVQSIAQKLSGSTTFVAQDLAMPLQTQQKPTISANAGQVTDASSLRQIQELFSDILEVPISEVGANTLLSDLGVDSLMATEILTEIQKLFDVTIELDELQDFPDIGSLAQRLGMWSSEVSNAIPTPATQSNGPNPDEVFAVADEKPFASVARESFGMVQREFDMISRDTNLESFYETVYPSQMELVVAYVVEAFDSLGCALGSLPVGASVPDIKILKEHSKVKNQLYRMLEVENIIKQDSAGKFVRTATPVPQASSKSLFNSIMSQFPQHIYEHSLLASTGSDLAGCLTGRINPLSILFGSAKARTLMENVYTHAPMFKTGTINLARYLVKIFNNFKENRPIRILELGAGTGGTSKYLVEALTATSQPFEYTFTDLSASLVAAARKKFAHYSNMKYTVFNIEEEPAPQFLGQYDIVISTNCIHATRDLSRSCTNINKVLSPDGILCLVELTRNLYWFDLVFGLLEGWWLFEDGRQHALANEQLWRKHLSRSRFRWVDWTVGASEESNLLRIITASPSELVPLETVEFKKVGDVSLQADIYYPSNDNSQKVLPVALMIHGGGHVMLSRKDIRPAQTQTLLDAGFLPVSVDYRLCPEVTLQDGPMRDVCDALTWCRTILPTLQLRRPDIRVDGSRVVAVGWSTGGHLALTLGFTAPLVGIQPPNATLAFYCPYDYEDPFWTRPNLPFGQKEEAADKNLLQYDLLEGVYDHPITAYNPDPATRALGGWMATSDPRSRIALYMNWKGRSLRVLLNGLSARKSPRGADSEDPTDGLPEPSLEQIQSVSPLAQIKRGTYQVPTYIIHGTEDDLIPWQQASRTHKALQQQGVAAEIRILEGAVHLYDLYRSYDKNDNAVRAIQEGYEFLSRHAAL